MAETDFEVRLFKLASNRESYRRSILDPAYQYIANYFWPDVSDIQSDKTEGTVDWFDRIYDSNPVRATQSCSVGVRNWVTPKDSAWLGLQPPPFLGRRGPEQPTGRMGRIAGPSISSGYDDARRWCSYAADELLQEIENSNFYSVVQPFNRSGCTFGTALLLMEEGENNAFNFEQFKIGTYVIGESCEKRVDTVNRKLKLTVRQLVQKFGVEHLPTRVQKMWKNNKIDDMITLWHHVMPMRDFKQLGGDDSMFDDLGLGASQMAFVSIYQDDSTKFIIKVGGFEEMPYFCLRWSRWGTENQVWGCSPAFEVLADGRQINGVTQFYDALVELKAYPRILTPSNLDGEVRMAAGEATVYDAEKPDAKPEEWATAGEVPTVLDMLARKEGAINAAFFLDIFKALSLLGEKLTQSTFGAARLLQAEKIDQFTGTFDQYTTEVITPLCFRGLGMMLRSGRIRPPPQSMMVQKGGDPKAQPQLAAPKVVITSRVTLALQAVKAQGLERTLEVWGPVAEQAPDLGVFDNLDMDEAFRSTSTDYGNPAKNLRPIDQVMAMRQQRAKMIQQQHALAMAQGAAKAGKDIGKAPQKMQDMANSAMEQMSGAG